MNTRFKIILLVAIQMVLIIASFLTIVHFESQSSLAGNIVNVAGKNRVLTSLVLLEISHDIFHNQPQGTVLISLGDLSYNIRLLKTGGTTQIETPPLDAKFDEDWNKIREKFNEYEESVLLAISHEPVRYSDVEQVERIGRDLVVLSDALTEKLGEDVSTLSSHLMILQSVLGVINVATHLLLFTIIWRILDRHTLEMIKLTKFSTIGQFAVSMAHNIKNPLGAMMYSTKRIKKHGDSDVIRTESDRINRCIMRISQQIDDVMNYTRAMPLNITTESVQDILRRATDMMDIPKNVTVNLPENDTQIRCDYEKIWTVFANIMRNAIQAIGDVPGHITIRLMEDENDAILEFENSGDPIPEGDMGRIFEPMYTTKMQGTGLGLASCKNILNAHGGSITVRNDPVTFTIRMPKKNS